MADLLMGVIEVRRERSPGLLPPIRVAFKQAVKALLQTPAGDYVKGSRAVNLKVKPTRKRARKKVK